MTIAFMVIGMPRSGTTWAANLLTTDTTLCLHDPLWTRHYSEWDAISSTKALGVACTGIGFWPEWLNQHPARKVILHRDVAETNFSLRRLRLPTWTKPMELEAIEGLHMRYEDIFYNAKTMWNHLLPNYEFDQIRFECLREMRMEPIEKVVAPRVDPALQARLSNELNAKSVRTTQELTS